MGLAVCLLAAGVVLLLWLLAPPRRLQMLGDLLPGPRAWPIVGNALHFHGTGTKSVECWTNHKKIYGSVFRIWIGPQLHVILSNPLDIQMLLSSHKLISKARLYDVFHDWLGSGLLISTGDLWHSRRKAITPTFHFKVLDEFLPIFNKCAETLVACLSDKANGRPFDVTPFVSNCALDSVSESAMGIKVEAQIKPKSEYVTSVNRITRLLGEKSNRPWLGVEPFYTLTGRKTEERERLQYLHSLPSKVLEEKKLLLTNISTDKKLKDDVGMKKRTAFLELLLNMKNANSAGIQSDQDILDEVTTFMFEGQDTTTSSLAFTLWLLGRHPDVQERLYAEVAGVLRERTELRMEDLAGMKYLERVLKESLRLFPPVPLIGRKLEEDVLLPSSGQTVPAGAEIYAGIILIHRDPELFPDPERFDPDRFQTDTQRHPYAFIPFSAGPRNCIGQKFAMLDMKVIISKFVFNYSITSEDDLTPDSELILRAADGPKIRITRRTNS